MFYKRKPNYNNLKIFGCLCFVSTENVGRTKLDQRAQKCVFLGYPANIKGYKVFDLKRRVIIISRNVIFIENVFPYKQITEEEKEIIKVGKPDIYDEEWEITHYTEETNEIQNENQDNGDNVHDNDIDQHLHNHREEHELHDMNETTPDETIITENSTQSTEEIINDHIQTNTGAADNNTNAETADNNTRKTTRKRKLPSTLDIYHHNAKSYALIKENLKYPIHNFLGYDKLSEGHKIYATNLSMIHEP